MSSPKRYHPLSMLRELGALLRNSVFFVIYLFVIRAGSESFFFHYGRIIFIVIFGLSLVSIIIKWLTRKYSADGQAFRLYRGWFQKKEQTIPYSRIQNINRTNSIFHRMFRVTSVQFDTGAAGENSAVQFPVISHEEALRLEEQVSRIQAEKRNKLENGQEQTADGWEAGRPAEQAAGIKESKVPGHEDPSPGRAIHFKAERKDLWRASITSLSFLLLIPLLITGYFQLAEFVPIGDQLEEWWTRLTQSWVLSIGAAIIVVFASVGFGILRTFYKYGNYTIASDSQNIYIFKGMVENSSFSIAKSRVQAVEVVQSPVQRLLRLAEVKLISAGSLNTGDGMQEINSLYPFLPLSRVPEIVAELLPSYQITQQMYRLPARSIVLRLVRPSWFWIISTLLLYYFQPSPLGMELEWWLLSIILFGIILVLRVLDFYNTRYIVKDQHIQFKTGSLSTSLFVTSREKMVEASITRSLLQKKLGLATIQTTNRAKPVRINQLYDVPLGLAMTFRDWYGARIKDIHTN